MAVLIGQASIDENGRISGGQAGDQKGNEVFRTNWYLNDWNVLLRAKEGHFAEKLADACADGCANDKIGYDQNDRNSLRREAQKVGFDLSKITNPCECDCSSFAAVCAEAAGVNMDGAYVNGNAPTTGTLRTKLKNTGKFEAFVDSKYLISSDNLRRGDILVNEGTHAIMVLSNGKNIPGIQPGSNPKTDDELYYRSHIQTYGTLPVVRDGMTSGSIGYARQLEAFWLDPRTVREKFPNLKFSGTAHIQTSGDINFSNIEHDTCIGTTGQSKRLEAFKLSATGLPAGRGLKYRAHVQGIGWQAWKSAGEWAGTIGESKRLEAIEIYID